MIRDLIYVLLEKTIDLYIKIRTRFDKEYMIKNSSRIREWKLIAYAYSRSSIGVLGGLIVFITVILAVIGPLVAPQPYWVYPIMENPETRYLPPCIPPICSGGPLLGTDEWGRDLLSIILYGFRISFVISIVIVLLGAPIGIILGLISGYKGGLVDETIMRLTDIFISFPGLILAIAFASVLPQRIREVLEANIYLRDFFSYLFGLRPQEYGQLAALLSVWFAMVIVWWPGYARVVRGSVLSVREQPFIEAAKLLGLSTWKIMTRHILPNIISPILVMMTFDLATATLAAAALSFLGLGPQEPVPELGYVISKAGNFFPEKSLHVVAIVGSVLLFIALGWNLLGDSLRDILDPKTRRSIEYRFERRRR
jgi:peptide/nickel transport system permease protein